jgi:hypothetical protein
MLQGKSISDSEILLKDLIPCTAASPPRQMKKTYARKEDHSGIAKSDSGSTINIDKEPEVSPPPLLGTVRLPPVQHKKKSAKLVSVFVPVSSVRALIDPGSCCKPEIAGEVFSSRDNAQSDVASSGIQVDSPPNSQNNSMLFYFPCSSMGDEDQIVITQSKIQTDDYELL